MGLSERRAQLFFTPGFLHFKNYPSGNRLGYSCSTIFEAMVSSKGN
jgi:hypothetical protein